MGNISPKQLRVRGTIQVIIREDMTVNEVKSPNTWTLRGRLTDDARSNARKQGAGNITNFRLAVNQPVFIGGEIDSRENYFNVTVYDAEKADVAAALQKGDKVEVIGLAQLRKSEWTDRDSGEARERWNMELHVTEGFSEFAVTLLESKAAAKDPEPAE